MSEPDPPALAGLPHLRRFQCAPGLWAWYDGRVEGYRAYPEPNWIDEGALAVGIEGQHIPPRTSCAPACRTRREVPLRAHSQPDISPTRQSSEFERTTPASSPRR